MSELSEHCSTLNTSFSLIDNQAASQRDTVAEIYERQCEVLEGIKSVQDNPSKKFINIEKLVVLINELEFKIIS